MATVPQPQAAGGKLGMQLVKIQQIQINVSTWLPVEDPRHSESIYIHTQLIYYQQESN